MTNNKQRRMVPLRYVLMPFGIIGIAIVLFIILIMMAPKPVKKPLTVKAPLVEVFEPQSDNIHFTIESQGTVQARTNTLLTSEVSGRVVHIAKQFVAGGFFKKGELIAKLDDISYQAALLQAESQLDSAKAALLEEQARSKQAEHDWKLTGKPLSEAPILALRKPQLAQAKAALKAAKANLEQAKIKLERTKIIAPYDAMVRSKNIDVGQYVTLGSQLGSIFAVDVAEVRLPVRQQDIEFINVPNPTQRHEQGSKVTLSMTINGKRHQWLSTIVRQEGEVNTRSRVHYVVAQIKDPYRLLNPSTPHETILMGSFVNAEIEGKALAGTLAIPRELINDGNKVYLVDDKFQLQQQVINILHSDHQYIYTQDKFANNLRMIRTKLETPVTGMALRVMGENDQPDQLEQIKPETATASTAAEVGA